MWHGGCHAVVVWCVGGRALAMSHGSGCTEVMVGVWWWLCRIMVAAWRGGGGRLHSLVVVVAVMSWWLQHGSGSSGGDSSHVAPQWPRGMAGSHMTWWWWWWPHSGGGGSSGSCVMPRCSCKGGGNIARPATRHTVMWHVRW